MITRPRIIIVVLLVLGLLAAAFAAKRYRKAQWENPQELVLRKPIGERQSPADAIQLVPIYPTADTPAPVLRGNFWASPQLVRLAGRPPFLLVLASSGTVAAIDPPTGRRLWESSLSQSSSEEIFARAAPAQFDDKLMVAYRATNRKTGDAENRAAVINLKDGTLASQFPTLLFDASLPAPGGGVIRFDQNLHNSRAIAIARSSDGAAQAYVTFSGTDETKGWHGWLFKVDLDRWRAGFASKAISAVFVPTPEAECDASAKICGGGMWAYGGPKIERGPTGPEILVQTGNGRLDLTRGDFAQSLIRLSSDLKFAPQCDVRLCAGTNPRDPAPACLATCRNLFVPRPLPTAPFTVPDRECAGKSYLECLELLDWDFGSSSPARIETAGHRYYVATGKAGDLFLLDGEVLGRLYDRKQAAPFCGTPTVPCPTWNSGLAITEPAVAMVGGVPMVIVTTFNVDALHGAGAAAYRVVGAPAAPHLQEAWRVPDPAAREAVKWFRAPPTRPIISTVGGDTVVWVADNAREGRILAIRARDGKVLANVRTPGWPMRNARPLIFGDVLYLPSAVQNRSEFTWIEAYRIRPRAGPARR